MVVFPILSYVMGGWMMGWASAPYDPKWAQQHPRRAAWMAIAGPGANFSLAILAGVLIHTGIWTGLFTYPEKAGASVGAATFVSLMFTLNLLLGTFNRLPVPALDGFGAVGLLLSEHNAARFQALGQSMRGFSYIGLLVAWQVFDPLFAPVFSLALKALYPGVGYGS